MPVIGYGDNYGDRYGEAYSVEVIQLPASAIPSLTETAVTELNTVAESGGLSAVASLSATEQGFAFESGRIPTTALVSGIESGLATESGQVQVSGATSVQELGLATESGQVVSLAQLSGVESGSATESGGIRGVSQPTISELARAFESGGVTATGVSTIDELVGVLESGGLTATPNFDIKAIGGIVESGGIEATARYRFTPLVSTDSDDPVDAFRTILQNVRAQDYGLPSPDIYAMWEVDPQQRLKNPDPTVYVWSPTPGSLTRFSADGDLTTDTRTVELMVMTYDAAQTHRYTESLIDIIGDYVDDNANLTVYEDVDVDTVADGRGDHIFGESDHYINTIEISTARLRPTNSR